jgi:hypothetical protein
MPKVLHHSQQLLYLKKLQRKLLKLRQNLKVKPKKQLLSLKINKRYVNINES